MKRILVADDEILVRVGIRALADWAAAGYEIAGEAASGEEAVALLDALQPDIILTDLVMGQGDGFFLIKELRERLPEAGIVILSCRNDFEAVREAMRLGADDYVFKLTMKAPEILEVLSVVSAKVDARRGASGRPAREERPAAGLEAALEQAGIEAAGLKAYRVALFQPASPRGQIDAGAFLQAVRELRRTAVPEFTALPYRDGRVLALVKGAYRGAPRELWAAVDEYSRRYLGKPADGGASDPASSPLDLPRAVREAEAALDYAFIAGRGFRESSDLPHAAALDGAALLRLGEAFRAAARSNGREGLHEAARGLFTLLGAASGPAPDRLRRAAWDFLAPLRERASAARLDIEELELEPGVPPHVAVLEAESLASLASWTAAFIDAVSARVRLAESSRCREEILRVMDWVRGDLGAAYTVEAAASLAAMSPSRFGHVFTKETGESFIQFVTRSKMDRARELLATTGLRVYEVAREVGYENPNYFSTIFKQVTGQSPQAARERGEGRAGHERGEAPPQQET